MKKYVCGFIGNFLPPYSTENDRKWSLLNSGHDVVTFQENETSPYTLIRYAEERKLDVLFYSHTHDPSYCIPNLIDVFMLYKKKGIPTVSVHLDKWAGLDREKDVGVEATWFTEWLFMADGSPDAVRMYKEHNLKWRWLPPAVVARDCYITPPDRIRFPHEIVFIGSKGYHKEYPFRPQMIEFLQKTYRNRFGHYGNGGIQVVRGHDLNVLCSTAKIVVGDSCFAGQQLYWSDRIPETVGRGGFLLHPIVPPNTIPHGFYKAGDLNDLKAKIDFWLDPANENKRRRLRNEGFLHVRKNDTYTNRMDEILTLLELEHGKTDSK